MKMLFTAIIAATISYPAACQQHTPPAIPHDGDSETTKRATCAEAINEQLGWQLGPAKRLREWCRNNGYISYKQQLEAEKLAE